MLKPPMRGSNVRLIVALIVASTLGAALIYSTVLGGTVDVVQVQQLLAKKAEPGRRAPQRHGRLARGRRRAARPACASSSPTTRRTRENPATARRISIVYHGSVPSAFRDGRAILIDGKVQGASFQPAQRHAQHEVPVEVLVDIRRAHAVSAGQP